MKEQRMIKDMKNFGFNFQNTYTTLPDVFFSRVLPTKVPSPKLVLLNESYAEIINLNFFNSSNQEIAEIFSGNLISNDMEIISQAYAGHQFGNFVILGDGRAHLLGEHVTHDGQRLDVQLKGSGKTPYSRRGDGKAALGPMLREYIISEAMHFLGIPTTRSLAVVSTGENIYRERALPGAILTRVAASHIRVGTFEFAAAQGDKFLVESLLDYTIKRHYPDLKDADNKALALLDRVMELQADLIVNWMRVGFIHGVMNTDNMTLTGETIDFGPCAFMDAYNPGTVFSSIDHNGRYAYANQPKIAQWNLARFAETLLPLIHSDINKAVDLAEIKINNFAQIYKDKWLNMMRAKLGLFGNQDGDENLVNDLLELMKLHQADYTNTFLDLSEEKQLIGKIYEDQKFLNWYAKWKQRIERNSKPLKSSQRLMKNTNPSIIPRNHKVEEALKSACEGDLAPVKNLLEAIKEPYKNKKNLKPYQTLPEESESPYKTFCGT